MQTPGLDGKTWTIELEQKGVKRTVELDRDPSGWSDTEWMDLSDSVFGKSTRPSGPTENRWDVPNVRHRSSGGYKKYGSMARETAKKYGIDPDWFEALITQESGWRTHVASGTGPAGIAQLAQRTAKGLGLNIGKSGLRDLDPNDERLDPAKALDAGARHLAGILANPKNRGDYETAMKVWYGGGGWATKYKEAAETHARRVAALRRALVGGKAPAENVAPKNETPKQRNIRLENERLRPKTQAEEARVGATTNRNMADFFKEAVQGLPVEPSIGKNMVPPKTAPAPPLYPSFLKHKPKQMPGMLGETTESFPNVERGNDVTQIGRIVPIGGQDQIGDIWRKMGMEPPAAPEDPAVKWRRETEAWNQWREGFGRDIASALKKGAGVATLPFGIASQVVTNGLSDLAGMLAGGLVTYPVDFAIDLEGLLTPGRTDEEYAKGGANVALGLLSLVPGAALAKFGVAGKAAEAIVDPVSVLLRKVIAPGYKASGKLWATVADNLQKRYGVVTEGGDQAVRRAMGENVLPMEGNAPAPKPSVIAPAERFSVQPESPVGTGRPWGPERKPLQTIKTQKGPLAPEELTDSQIADNIFRIQNLKRPTAKHKADLEALQGELNRRREGASGTPGPKPIAEVSQGGSTPPASTIGDFEVSGPFDTNHNPFGTGAVSTSRNWYVKASNGDVAAIHQTGGAKIAGELVPIRYEVSIHHSPTRMYGTPVWDEYRATFDSVDEAIADAKAKLPELAATPDSPVEAPTSPVEAPLPVRPTSDTPQEVQPVSVSPVEAPKAKEPWEMTRDEFDNPGVRESSKDPLPPVSLTYYHGTNSEFPISEFKSESKSVNDFGLLGPVETERSGIFLTSNKDFAAEYGKKVVPVKINWSKAGKTADVPNAAQDFLESLDSFSDADKDVWNTTRWHQNDWEMFEGETGRRFVKFLKEQGYDSASFDEFLPPTATRTGAEVGGETLVVFDPAILAEGNHRTIVESALRDGKPVPPDVLADYPDLAAKYPQSPVEVTPPVAATSVPKRMERQPIALPSEPIQDGGAANAEMMQLSEKSNLLWGRGEAPAMLLREAETRAGRLTPSGEMIGAEIEYKIKSGPFAGGTRRGTVLYETPYDDIVVSDGETLDQTSRKSIVRAGRTQEIEKPVRVATEVDERALASSGHKRYVHDDGNETFQYPPRPNRSDYADSAAFDAANAAFEKAVEAIQKARVSAVKSSAKKLLKASEDALDRLEKAELDDGSISDASDALTDLMDDPPMRSNYDSGEDGTLEYRSERDDWFDSLAEARDGLRNAYDNALIDLFPKEVTPSAVQESSATPKIVGDQPQSSGGVREGLPQEPAGTGAQETPQAQETPVGGKRNVFLGGNAGKRATVTFADERQEASVVLGSKLRNRNKGTGKAGQGKTGTGKTPQDIEAEIAGARDAMREHFPGLSDAELDSLARKADTDVRGQTKGLKDGAEVVLKQTAEIEAVSGGRKVQRGGITYELDGPAAKAWADADNEYRRAMKEAIDRDDPGMKKVASEQRTATRNAILDSDEGVTETGKTFERAVADARNIEDPVAQFEALIEAGKIPHSGGGAGSKRRGAISMPDANRLIWAYAVMKVRIKLGIRDLNELMKGLMQGLGENAHAIADRLPRLARRALSDHEAGTVTSDETLLKLVEYEERGAHDDIRDNLLYIHNNDTELVDSLLSDTGEKAKAQMESGNRAYLGADDKARTNTIGKLVGKANDGKPWSHEEQSFIVTAMADYKDRVKNIKGAVDAAIDASDQAKARELGAGLDDLEGMYDDMAMALYRARSEMGRALGNPPTLRSVDDPIYVRFEIERRLGRRLNPADPYDANTISNVNELAGNLQKLGVNEDDVARAASIESAKMLIVGRERRKLTLEQLAKKKENAAKNYDRELRRVIREATEKISLNPVTDPVAVVRVVKSAAEMVFWKRIYQLSDPVQPIDFAKTVQAELQRALAANPTAFSPAERQLILGASDTDILDVFSGFRGFQTPKTKTIQEMELTEMRGLSRLFRSLQLIKSGVMPPSSPKLQQISRDLELIRKRKHEIKSEINALIMAQTPTTLSQTGAIIGRGLRLTDAVQRIADGLGTGVNQGTRLYAGNLQYLVDKTLNPKSDAVVPFSLPLEGMWSMLSDPIGNATEYGKVMRRVYMGQDIGAKFGRGVSNYAANFQPGTPSHTLASILDVGAKGMSAFPAIADAATEPILARGVYAKRLAWSRGKKIAQANGVSRADAARMVMLSDREAILDVANIVKEGLLFSRDNWLSQFFTNITKKIEKAPLPQGSVARAATVTGRLITRMTIDFAAAFPRFFWNFAVANAQYAGAGVPYGVVKHLAHPRGVERSPASRIAVAESIERGITGMILGYGIGGELLMNTLIANGLANPEIDPYGDTSLGLTFRYGKAVEGVMRQMPGIMMPLRMGMDRAIARRMLAQREAQLLNGETPTVTDEQARQLSTMVNAEGSPLGAVKMAANDVIRGFTEMPLFTGVEHAAKLASGRDEPTDVAADTAIKTLFVYWPGFARGWARNQDLEKDIRRFPGWEAALDTDDAITGVVRTVQRIRDEALVRLPFANESVKAKVNGYTVPFGEEAAMYLKAYGKSFSVGEVPEGIVNQSMRDLYAKIVNVKVAGWLDEHFTEAYQREGKAGVDRIKAMTKDQKTEAWEELTKVKTLDPRTLKPKTVDGDLAYAIKDARDYAESIVTKLQGKR